MLLFLFLVYVLCWIEVNFVCLERIFWPLELVTLGNFRSNEKWIFLLWVFALWAVLNNWINFIIREIAVLHFLFIRLQSPSDCCTYYLDLCYAHPHFAYFHGALLQHSVIVIVVPFWITTFEINIIQICTVMCQLLHTNIHTIRTW